MHLSGEIDYSNIDDIRAVVDTLAPSQPARLVLDVGALRFMDSVGLALLVHLAHQIDDVELRGASAAIRRLIEITGLEQVLRLV